MEATEFVTAVLATHGGTATQVATAWVLAK
jgi:hypothetical protein